MYRPDIIVYFFCEAFLLLFWFYFKDILFIFSNILYSALFRSILFFLGICVHFYYLIALFSLRHFFFLLVCFLVTSFVYTRTFTRHILRLFEYFVNVFYLHSRASRCNLCLISNVSRHNVCLNFSSCRNTNCTSKYEWGLFSSSNILRSGHLYVFKAGLGKHFMIAHLYV